MILLRAMRPSRGPRLRLNRCGNQKVRDSRITLVVFASAIGCRCELQICASALRGPEMSWVAVRVQIKNTNLDKWLRESLFPARPARAQLEQNLPRAHDGTLPSHDAVDCGANDNATEKPHSMQEQPRIDHLLDRTPTRGLAIHLMAAPMKRIGDFIMRNLR